MTATYPGAIKIFTAKTNKVDLVDAAHINILQEETVAMQTEIGTNPSGSQADLNLRLAVIMGTDGAFQKGTSFPTAPSPIEGQLFYRTDEEQVYFFNGLSAWQVFGDPITAIPKNIQVFTSNDTWTKPAGISKVYVKVWGGGGGGGSGDANGAGAGGGGGGYSEGLIAVSGNVTVIVGEGGTSASAGSISSFAGDVTIQATGGSAGVSSGGAGGGAGVGSNGTINLTGQPGQTNGGDVDTAGHGGGSPIGGSGGSGADGVNSARKSTVVGGVPGGGGGGGSDGGTNAGATGAAGLVIIYY